MIFIGTNNWYSTYYGSRDETKRQLIYVVKLHRTRTKDSAMVVWYQPEHSWTFFEEVPVPNWDWEKYEPTERDWQVVLVSIFQHWGKIDDT